MLGQSGMLAGGLLALSLALLWRRPVLAGIALGLLTYKPHLGLLFPLLLLAGRHWAAFLAASATTLALALLSALAFGTDAWAAFLGSIGTTGSIYLGGAQPVCSVHGVVLAWTGDARLAAALHGAVLLAVAGPVLLAWRRGRAAPEALAAAAIAAGMLATPYVFVSDAVLLTVAAIFLLRAGLREGMLPGEAPALLLAVLLPALVAAGVPAAVPAASLLLAALALRRCRRAG
jgi:hypothetical protein